ncbi:MAG: hypothetical protein SGJ20_10495 [Planctomycetota bacterium]|nr:hypothetical protein [Planctomycetota bacterium]
MSQTDHEDMRLPADLVEFLRAGRQLEYVATMEEIEDVVLKDLSELTLREIYVDPSSTDFEMEDPSDVVGYYVVPGVSLVAMCGGEPDNGGLLIWFPAYGQYGQWDREHNYALRFVGKTWKDIVADPARYLAEGWMMEEKSAVPVLPWRDPNPVFREGDAPW